MMKVAHLLSENAALGPVWKRLQAMWTEAKASERKTTQAQESALAWLSTQKDIASKAAAVSNNDNPAP
jgi:hypothetical protein